MLLVDSVNMDDRFDLAWEVAFTDPKRSLKKYKIFMEKRSVGTTFKIRRPFQSTNQYHYSSWHSKIMSFSAPRCPSHGHRFLCSSIFLISSFCACSLKWKTQDQNWSVDVTQIYFRQIQFRRIPKSKVYYCTQKFLTSLFFFFLNFFACRNF